MVNDVLQKHKAFWHPGRGSPYHINLNEGRARREFPSNAKGSHSRDDENMTPHMGYGKRPIRSTRRTRDHILEHNDMTVPDYIQFQEPFMR